MTFPTEARSSYGRPGSRRSCAAIAFDVEELARPRRIDDLQAAAVGDDPRAERRRRLAEPDLTFAEFCDRTGTPWRSTLQGDRAWDAYQAELFRRGERDEPYSPYRQPRRPAPPDGRTEN
ncbi:hypothetical protein [Streptomyces shenzhenensis]|uniref:hypothetical protein n=1 Tax=Streptomyces shenzhenensis TaxID=943815 RepID=UPI0015F01666|nr:hypothetical protein [Streptomyces shenzhenensis]